MTPHLTSDELDRLRAVAKAATQFINEKAVFEVLKFAARDKIPEEQLRKDAAHIAAFNPRTCLALLDELTALREENAVLKRVRETYAAVLADKGAEVERLTKERDEAEVERIEWVRRGECAEELCDALRAENEKLRTERDQARALLEECREAFYCIWALNEGFIEDLERGPPMAYEMMAKLRAAREGGA